MVGQIPSEVPGLSPSALPQRKRRSVCSYAEGMGSVFVYVCMGKAFNYCSKTLNVVLQGYIHYSIDRRLIDNYFDT